MRLTPSLAISRECRRCKNGYYFNCSSVCKLNGTGTPLRKIKAHCITCVSEQNIKGVRACTFDSCILYPYREGHNPRRKGIGQKHVKNLNSQTLF